MHSSVLNYENNFEREMHSCKMFTQNEKIVFHAFLFRSKAEQTKMTSLLYSSVEKYGRSIKAQSYNTETTSKTCAKAHSRERNTDEMCRFINRSDFQHKHMVTITILHGNDVLRLVINRHRRCHRSIFSFCTHRV